MSKANGHSHEPVLGVDFRPIENQIRTLLMLVRDQQCSVEDAMKCFVPEETDD